MGQFSDWFLVWDRNSAAVGGAADLIAWSVGYISAKSRSTEPSSSLPDMGHPATTANAAQGKPALLGPVRPPLSIAAASVLAKTYRDDFMCKIHQEYPVYNWNCNKGYPSKLHRERILEYGICPYHRKSFNLTGQLKLPFN